MTERRYPPGPDLVYCLLNVQLQLQEEEEEKLRKNNNFEPDRKNNNCV